MQQKIHEILGLKHNRLKINEINFLKGAGKEILPGAGKEILPNIIQYNKNKNT